jgi:DNA-binding NtrC family response regulator
MDKMIRERSHILIVDDEESLRLSLRIFLEKDGYCKISDVSTCEEALGIVSSQDIDLIFCDIRLQGTSGIEVLRQVKKMKLKCPVVMITGYPSEKTIEETERLGAFEYMRKPLKKDAFLRVTRMALVQHYC